MKILGIIAEYNPFHNWHKYHLEESKKITGADCAVAVMSGNFVQRGEFAVIDKWTRSRLAVDAGIDLVLELPFIFACNRAEVFACGAVDILAGIGADYISFGSESGDITRLRALAADMKKHEKDISLIRAEAMEKGSSFAKGLQLATEQVLGKEKASLMLEPNNILALEYLKRLLYWEEKGHIIEPLTVKRYGSGYLDSNEAEGFAGARAIRNMLRANDDSDDVDNAEDLSKYMPAEVVKSLEKAAELEQAEEKAFQILRSEIVKNSPSELSKIYCVGEGLENKLKKEIVTANSLQDLISRLVSRRYTEAAVKRMLVYVLMGLKNRNPQMSVYGRVLAAGEKGRKLLKALKRQENISIPMITNVNKDVDGCKQIDETLEYDLLAADMYNILMNRNLYEFSDKVINPYIKA